MIIWLNEQNDMVALIYRLAFFLLATIMLMLNRQTPRPLPWHWLGWFALTHGCHKLLSGIVCRAFEHGCLLSIRWALLVISFLCLMEFARAGTAALTGRSLGRWLYLPLLGLLAAGFWGGTHTTLITTRYCLALPAGLWAAWVLNRYCTDQRAGLALRSAAFGMLFYALLSGLLTSPGDFFPASSLNQHSLIELFGIPTYFLRTLVIVMVALAFWRYFQQTYRIQSQEKKIWFLRTHSARRLIVMLMLTLTAGWVGTEWTGREKDRDLRNELLLRAQFVADLVDSHRFALLTGSPKDITNPHYQALKQGLIAMHRTDPRIRFLYLSGRRAGEIFFFMDSEDAQSVDCSKPGDRYREASTVFHQVFLTGRPATEGPLPDRWGTWVSAFAPITNEQGHVVAVLGMDVDAQTWAKEIARHRLPPLLATLLISLLLLGAFATEQRLREVAAALATSERQYHSLFEDNAAVMLLHDEQTLKLLDVNAAAAAFYGYSCEQMMGMSLLQLSTRSESEIRQAVAQLYQGSFTFRSRHRLCNGTLRDIEVFLSRLTRQQRPCVFAIIRDITSQERAEEQMALQSAALSAAANGIVITNRAGEIIWVNPAFASLSGYSLAEAMGQNPRILKSGKHDQAFYAGMWHTIAAGEVWRGELINRRKNGSLYTEQMTITPVRNSAGETTHFIAIKQDITEQLELQQQFLQAQRMESIGRLAAGVAHDFNNQLQGILGFGDLLKRGTDKNDPRYADIEEVINAAQQAATISRQLLNFSRRQPVDMQVIDLNKVIHDAQAMHQRLLGEDIKFELQLATDLDRIKANASQIEQVLMNLLINARDAMPQGGRLTISTFNITLEACDLGRWNDAHPGRFIVLAISDTGVGVAPENLPHIFEPFFSTKAQGRGTGLGLASVYGIARQHGGWVHVYSQQGIGTTFKVYLPTLLAVTTPAITAAAPPSEPLAKGQNQRILLVEDETGVRLLAQRVLQKNNYSITAVASVTEALQQFESATRPFDMVFSDVVLPDGNGLELVEQLLQRQPTLRVVMASGYTDEHSRWSAIQARGFRFLSKPYPVATLLRAIQETLAAPTKS